MPLVPLVTVVMVFAIPILGIVLAGYKEWLKFKSKPSTDAAAESDASVSRHGCIPRCLPSGSRCSWSSSGSSQARRKGQVGGA
ncbi:MAG: hypothetical protein BRD34_00735 [Bacteroidetes bacterium QH_6_64_77]|nr:MAG: hypothetical protein BRD34_00735 [Bacteroidetes bacterium QH_6_64_77]